MFNKIHIASPDNLANLPRTVQEEWNNLDQKKTQMADLKCAKQTSEGDLDRR